MQDSSDRLLNITEILNVLFKYKWVIINTFVVAMVIALLYVFLKTPVYVAKTELLVKLGREKLAPLTVLPNTQANNIIIQERPENIQDEIAIITNPVLTYRIIPELKAKLDEIKKRQSGKKSILKRIKTFFDAPIRWVRDIPYKIGLKKRKSETERLFSLFRNSLMVKGKEESNVITVAFRWDNPEFAAFAANLYTKAYLSYREKINKSQRSIAFYENQIKTYGKLLKEIEDKIEEFQEKHGIASIEKQKEILLNQKADLEKRFRDVSLKLSEISLKKESIKKLLSESNEWIETPQIGRVGVHFTDLAPLDKKYFELKVKLDEIIQIFTPEAREVRFIKEQIEKLRKQKAESLLNILSIEETNLEGLQSKLDKQLKQVNKELTELSALQLKYRQLQRTRKIYEDNFLLYTKKAEELRIMGEMDKWKIASVQIISPAVLPLDPVWPKKKLILIVVGAISFLVGVMLAFLKELFSVTIDRGGDLNKLGVKHITTIPHINF